MTIMGFIIINYFLLILISICLGVCFTHGKHQNQPMVAQIESKNITRELALVNLFIITIVRVYIMDLAYIDSLRYLTAGTVGTMMFRTFMTNIASISMMLMFKQKNND